MSCEPVNRSQDEKRDRIVAEAMRLFNYAFVSGRAGVQVVPRAACLYHTACLLLVGAKHGLRLIPQAGSAAWPRMPLSDDDGEVHTHFAYEWMGANHPETKGHIAAGRMPEIHVWAADIDSREVIDVTTQYLPEQCRQQGSMAWSAPAPPPYFWGNKESLPDYWLYLARMDAIEFIADDIADCLRRLGLVASGHTLRETDSFTIATKEQA